MVAPLGNDYNTKHGAYSQKVMIRELLGDQERAVWDAAPVPPRATAILDETIREFYVTKWRIHSYLESERFTRDTKKLTGSEKLHRMLNLMEIPMRAILKSLEVHARMKEANVFTASEEALLAHLRALPATELTEIMLHGEFPRLDPGTGLPLLQPGDTGSRRPSRPG